MLKETYLKKLKGLSHLKGGHYSGVVNIEASTTIFTSLSQVGSGQVPIDPPPGG